jgi:cysteine desulfurase
MAMQSSIVYLDYNATTPVDDRVLDRMLPFFKQQYANPSSPHLFALQVQEEIEFAQQDLAHLINCNASELTFTSGATEAINMAIKGLSYGHRKHIICASTEHNAVLECCRFMETKGYSVTYLPVDKHGIIASKTLEDSLTADTALVCVMLVNNETGVMQDIPSLSAITHQAGAWLLCDATQAVGKIPIDVKQMGIDLMPISAHKFYGPKGIGALYSNPAVESLRPLLHGGQQQNGMRSGTLNVPGIVGLGAAAAIAKQDMSNQNKMILTLRDTLEKSILEIDETFVNGHLDKRIFNTTNISLRGIHSQEMVLALGNIAVSSGSACSSVTNRPSPVLQAMGLRDEDNLSAIRFSVGRFTTDHDIDYTLDRIKKIVAKLRG